jgi:protein SCO1/2
MPSTDTPEVLKAYAEKRGLDGWLLLSGNDDDVRTLAMVLDVKYLPAGETEISHSNLITILGTQGSVEHKIQGTSVDLKNAMQTLR